jgi:hypothetical protein
MKKLFLTVALVFGAFATINAQEILTNQAVVHMKSAGLSDNVIKTKIASSQDKFDTSTDGIIALKKAGISDDVINLMVAQQASQNTPAEVSDVPSGIFYENSAGKQQLFAGTFSEAQTAGKKKLLKGLSDATGFGAAVFGKGMGAVKVIQSAETVSQAADFVGEKVKVSLAGTEANIKVSETKPVFYFQFNETENFNKNVYEDVLFGETTSPNQFILVKLDKTKKSRELVVGKDENVLGDSRGIPEKYKIPIVWQQTGKGIFKVTPQEDLASGEYGFMLSANGLGTYYSELVQPKIFDFSVK